MKFHDAFFSNQFHVIRRYDLVPIKIFWMRKKSRTETEWNFEFSTEKLSRFCRPSLVIFFAFKLWWQHRLLYWEHMACLGYLSGFVCWLATFECIACVTGMHSQDVEVLTIEELCVEEITRLRKIRKKIIISNLNVLNFHIVLASSTKFYNRRGIFASWLFILNFSHSIIFTLFRLKIQIVYFWNIRKSVVFAFHFPNCLPILFAR